MNQKQLDELAKLAEARSRGEFRLEEDWTFELFLDQTLAGKFIRTNKPIDYTNARYIVAAANAVPELLAMIEEASNIIAGYVGKPMRKPIVVDIAARAFLAKLRGE